MSMWFYIVFFYSYSTTRKRGTNNATSIRGIQFETSINHREEEYYVEIEYKKGFPHEFQKQLLKHFNNLRQSPSLKKCIIVPDLKKIPEVTLKKEFNKKLNEKHKRSLLVEITRIVKNRVENPNFFSS